MSVNRSDDGIAPCPVIANLAAKHGMQIGLEDQPAEKSTVLRTPREEKVTFNLDCTDFDPPAESVLECASTECGSPSVAGSGSPSAESTSPPRSVSPPSPEASVPSPETTLPEPDGQRCADSFAQSCAHAEHIFQARAQQMLIARLRATKEHAARLKEERAGGQSTDCAAFPDTAAPEAVARAEETRGVDMPAWLSLVTIALLVLALLHE
jgi:hypothetical protein